MSTSENSSEEDVSCLLSVLALVCPRLQQLQVSPNVDRQLLAAFGTSCSELTCLRVLFGTQSEAFEQLHVSMPNISHCYLEAPVFPLVAYPWEDDISLYSGPCRLMFFPAKI